MKNNSLDNKVVLITGGAKRIGAMVAQTLHQQGMRVVIHYRSSSKDAKALQRQLEDKRPNSVALVKGDLLESAILDSLIEQVNSKFGQLDCVINNASTFYPTPLGKVTEDHWNDLIGTNLKAPFFLAQAAAPFLKQSHGCLINMVDIYGMRPLSKHPVYCSAKAGLIMLTKALARDLGPEIRVNAIAPGAILWPEGDEDLVLQKKLINRTPLKRMGDPQQIADAILFLIRDADYTTGHVLPIDGGRSIVP